MNIALFTYNKKTFKIKISKIFNGANMASKPFKITFKKNPKPTGLARIGSGWSFTAKHKGQKFAIISGGRVLLPGVTIQVAIKSQRENNDWIWLFIARHDQTIKTEEEAKQILQNSMEAIMRDHQLHFFKS